MSPLLFPHMLASRSGSRLVTSVAEPITVEVPIRLVGVAYNGVRFANLKERKTQN